MAKRILVFNGLIGTGQLMEMSGGLGRGHRFRMAGERFGEDVADLVGPPPVMLHNFILHG
jgi:hypothetical protein